MEKICTIASDFIAWDYCLVTGKMTEQMGKICQKYNLTIDRWEGNNDRTQCYFTPEISEDEADNFCEFVESLR